MPVFIFFVLILIAYVVALCVLCGKQKCINISNTPAILIHRYKRSPEMVDGTQNSPNDLIGSKTVDGEKTECYLATGCKDPSRRCFHVPRVIRLNDGSVLEANAAPDKGYCFQYENLKIQCDRRFGEPVTGVTGSGRLQTECRCFWPSLFDRKDIGSDCSSLVRACGGSGKLIHVPTGKKLDDIPPDESIDIHEFECEIYGGSNCMTPGRDFHTGLPSYVPTPVSSRTGGLCLYEDYATDGDKADTIEPAAVTGNRTTSSVIAVKGDFVSRFFANSFENATDSGDSAYVPNPCAFDAFRGVAMKNECRLTLSPSGIGYCEPLSETVSTVVFDDDYLPNNGGRYSNACYKFTDSERNIDAYIGEYFVRPRVTLQLSDDSKTRRLPPPLPVMSVEIEIGKLIPEVLDMLHVGVTTSTGKRLLITQAAIPEDAESIPVPFDKTTMSKFQKERNDFVFYLPTKYALFNYWAPVQPVKISKCDEINEERDIAGFTPNTIEASEYEIERQRHVVACREPYYDKRLSVVPNLDVNPLGTAYNANPTSAILRFDKSDFLVKPYWYRSYFNNRQEVKAYVSNLPSRPYSVQ